MNLSILTLLMLVSGMVCAHPKRDGDDRNEIIQMLSNLQKDVSSLVNQQKEIKGKLVDYQERLDDQQEILAIYKEKISDIEEIRGSDNPTAPLGSELPKSKQQDCFEYYYHGDIEDGVYIIYALDTPVQVFCDMTNGGWTVIQKRTDNSLDYTQDMFHYRIGIGYPSGEHWLGLDNINILTKNFQWTLRFDLTSFEGETRWAEYDNFRVEDGPYFPLLFDVGSYRGDAGDTGLGLSYHNGSVFSTWNSDRDSWSDGNCAADYFYGGGGFWYASCGMVSTTGMPYGEPYSISWANWKGNFALKSVVMKMKRKP